MTDAARSIKIVEWSTGKWGQAPAGYSRSQSPFPSSQGLCNPPEWSEEDGAFVGQCPGLIGPCCHGDDEVEVYRALRGIVEEWVEMTHRDGSPLPPPTAGTLGGH